ncbi:DHA2 family efflux MFS transporter permease subunit [Paenibacillus nasutitermitis]|uniref:MFS transporter n=1 Tax=Paenibacillus nasutitermitis TaxID=1652958 RepID=A0A917DV96_9BACL|nr:DHA2 family efflux MFS transporter permease subunit [Paenibacillus nasutitermitis]GGD71956.1 MFS transporter [Paenibacillus nasutitermitis]
MEKTTAKSSPAAEEFRLTSIMVPLLAIIAGVFMVILDSTAMNVALTKLAADFNTGLPTLQWTVTAYLLAQAAVIPLAGWLSDRYGAKTIFLTSVCLFTIGSVLCATPNKAEWLIVFRVLQGLGGGFVLPVAMAYVFRLSPPHKVGAVMGMMGVPILFAPAIGPTLSGWLVEYHSWRWIFLLNIPIGIICLLIGIKYLPKVTRNSVAGMDWIGMILGPLAFASLSYGVSEGAHSWTSDKTLTGLIVGGIALVAFIIVELKVRTPLLELRVFRSIDFSLGILVQWVGQFALYGAIFLMPQFLQQARGYGAFDTGLILIPQALASGLMMPLSGFLFDKIGVRWLVVAGLSLVSGAIYQYSLVDATTVGSDLILPLIMAGMGMGLMMMPLNTHLMSKAPRNLVSRVTALTNGLQMVINSLAVASLVTILTSKIKHNVSDLAVSTADGAAVDPKLMLEASINGYAGTFHIMIFIALFGAVLGLVLRRGSQQAVEAAASPGDKAQAGIMHG